MLMEGFGFGTPYNLATQSVQVDARVINILTKKFHITFNSHLPSNSLIRFRDLIKVDLHNQKDHNCGYLFFVDIHGHRFQRFWVP